MLRPLLRKTVPLLTGPCRTAGVSTLSRPMNFAGHHNNLTLGAKQSSFVKINKSLWHRAFSSAGGDLSGTWYNQFGSKMQIILLENGELRVFYFNCTPGSKPAKEILTGFVRKDEHASRFGFTVDFQNFAGHHNNLTLGAKQSSFVKINKSLWHRAFSSAGCDLSGTWYNQFGSKMQIIQLENGELIGFYFHCTPGTKPAKEKLTGFVGKDEHASRFCFTVDFQNGRYTTTWIGRCIKEGSADGEEVLLTNWIMAPNPEDGAQHLESIQVGQDRFTTKP